MESADPDEDALTYTFSWEVDGAASTAEVGTTTHEGDTLLATGTYPEQLWTCMATADDGEESSGAADDSVIIGYPPLVVDGGVVTLTEGTLSMPSPQTPTSW